MMVKRLDRFFDHNLLTHFLLYGLFFFVLWFVHMGVISLITFFHLQLSHSFAIIDNWITDQAWMIAVICKLCASFVVIKCVSIWSSSRRPFVDSLIEDSRPIDPLIWVVSLFLFAFCLILGSPVVNEFSQFSFWGMISSFLLIGTFYSCDVVVINMVEQIYPTKGTMRLSRTVLYCLMNFLFLKNTFVYTKGFDFPYLFSILLLVSFISIGQRSWKSLIPYLGLYIFPLYIFLGEDLFWNSEYSPFVFSRPIESVHYLIMLLATSIYLYYKQRRSA
ncbi:hypothetical protein HBN50_12350 [Halobacteriovorax sp. GB3]|uniref:hypothetical protein n=1 Tax=Halobacteriovorax sp. GB3 TaxID=2719615 RepID=UPI0023624B93|nr:hypothetical protein [Halobacteriovorax sp. GB3]MDD0853894.1 hypothetical protein [Halobacteriovorax sp. GB3]